MSCRPEARSRGWLAALAVVAALAAPGAAAPPDLGVRDGSLIRTFTPRAAPPGAYEVYRSPRPITELAAELEALDSDPVADAWKLARKAPVDAFGSDAPYDAPKLARLYLSSAPLVARGSLRLAEGVVGYTLIAPWPDASLSSLQPGTMVIVVHVAMVTGNRGDSR